MRFHRENNKYPGYKDFLENMAENVNDPVYGNSFPQSMFMTKSRPLSVKSSSYHTSGRSTCIVCGGDHIIIYCISFKNMNPEDRRRVADDHKLCYNCLYGGHYVNSCRSQGVSNINMCKMRHNSMLHSSDTIVNASASTTSDTYMPVVTVLVNNEFECYALLDTASNTSFCSQKLVDRLKLKGVSTNLNMSTLNNVTKNVSKLVNVTLSTVFGKYRRDLSCYVIKNIPTYTPYIDVTKYPYLQGLTFPHNVQVDLLIGQDNAGLLVPFEVQYGVGNQPFASRTLYGWCLNGPAAASKVNLHVITNFVDSTIEEGVHGKNRGMSREYRSVVDLWNEECKFVNGKFEIPIAWRSHCRLISSNKIVALSRLEGIVKSLRKKGKYELYDDEMKKLVEEGYAESIPIDRVHEAACFYPTTL